MKRDMELVRKVLLAVEEHPEPSGWVDLNIDGHTAEEVSYHVKIMGDGGLLEAEEITAFEGGTDAGFCWKPESLTWHGHEFLDTVKNDTVWRKTMAVVKEKGGAVSFELLKAVAAKYAKDYFNIG